MEDRSKEIENFRKKQARQYRVGGSIVFAIAALNVLFSLISAMLEFRLVVLIFQIGLSVALFAGVVWVRYLFVVGAVLHIIIGMNWFAQGLAANRPAEFIALVVIEMVVAGISALLLLFSPAVKEFLYEQKYG